MNRAAYLFLVIISYGVAIQQVLELVDSAVPDWHWNGNKKAVFKALAAISGMLLLAVLHREVLNPTQVVVGGMVIAAATEAANSILKGLAYRKESRKAGAALALSSSGTISIAALSKK